jgi:Tfp pilus assembly protein PilN
MLRANLSTRPFYNERLATLLISGIAVVALALSMFNGWQLVALSRQRAEVRARLDTTLAEIDRVQAEIATLRQSVDRPTLARLTTSAREANSLIDARTFSWTTLLGLLEKTLPFDVRLTAVSPRVERGTIRVAMNVVARDLDDLDGFLEALGEAGAFTEVVPAEQRRNDDGQHAALVEATYHPPPLAPSAPDPAPAGKPAAAPLANSAPPAGGRP